MHRKRTYDCYTLLLSTGELTRISILLVYKTNSSQQVFCFLLGFLPFLLLYQNRRQGDVIKNGHMREELVGLEYHSNLLANLGNILILRIYLLVTISDLSVLNRLQAIHGAKKCALTASGGADNHQYLSLMNLKREVIQNCVIVVPLYDMIYIYKNL